MTKNSLKDSEKTTSREAWDEAARTVLDASARQLSLSMRYIFASLNRLKRVADPRFAYTATDGEHIYYNPMKLCMRAKQGQVYINRTYVHMLMHCIFPAIRKSCEFTRDLSIQKDMADRFVSNAENTTSPEKNKTDNAPDESGIYTDNASKRSERELWDIASDIHAEYIIDGMETPALMLPESDTRMHVYSYLTDKCGILSIENIYSRLREESEETLAVWEELFYVDDHSPWPHMSKENNDAWEKQRAALAGTLPAYGSSKGEQRLLKALKVSERSRVSYKDFLKKFMQIREETRLDPDSFDYGYYNYGLTLYGDMPLIEELETKEAPTFEEFIIAIDTSGSCAGNVTESFLRQTLTLINDLRALSDNKTRIRLVQCDREIRSDTIIPANADVSGLLSNTEVRGFGGTDFRPVFKYARNMINSGTRISGMIYFTDGYGLYPVSRPPWKTAFVFPKEPDFDDPARVIQKNNVGEAALLRPPDWALTHVPAQL